MAEEQKPKYMDDLTCCEVWADTIQVTYGSGATIRIEFCVDRCTQSAPVHIDRRVPVGRVVMTAELAKVLIDHLTLQLEDLRQKLALAQTPPHGSSN